MDVQAAETVDLGGLARQQQVGSVDCASRSPGRRCGRRRRAGRDRRSGRRPCRQPARSADAEAKVPPLRMEIVKRSVDMKGFVVSAAPLGCRAPFLLVRTQPASRQGLRKPYRNPGHLRYPRLHSAGPQAARQGVGPDDGGLQSIVKRPSPERPATTGTRRLRPFARLKSSGKVRPTADPRRLRQQCRPIPKSCEKNIAARHWAITVVVAQDSRIASKRNRVTHSPLCSVFSRGLAPKPSFPCAAHRLSWVLAVIF